jgi:heme exporter protein A
MLVDVMLQVQGLGCERDRRQLFRSLAFSLSPGELLQIVGSNGSGKSTLLRILVGLFTDFEGDVNWSLEKPPLYLGHRVATKDSLTVKENVVWLSELHSEPVCDAGISEALASLGLTGFEDTYCSHLSAGQKKRVSLVQFLLHPNPCWIMDEPFSAIDIDGMAYLESCFQGQISGGGAIIFTSHQPLAIDNTINTLELSE